LGSSLPDLPPGSRGDIRSWLSNAGGRDCAIYRVLGIRNTVGSVLPVERRLLLLPSRDALLRAANTPHEPRTKREQRTNGGSSTAGTIDGNGTGKINTIHTQQLPTKKTPTGTTTRTRNNKHRLLTVAARARSKHAPRAVTERSFFGVARGSVPQQNQETVAVVERILEDCVWINSHTFGGLFGRDENSTNEADRAWIVEVRQVEGYGARWLVRFPGEHEGTRRNNGFVSPPTVSFRGFLEPQMEDGHERNWRH